MVTEQQQLLYLHAKTNKAFSKISKNMGNLSIYMRLPKAQISKKQRKGAKFLIWIGKWIVLHHKQVLLLKICVQNTLVSIEYL